MGRDRIFINDLRVDCVVGILAHERGPTQPLFVDLDLVLDTAESAYTGDVRATCDYGQVSSEVASVLMFRRYELLETAAVELAAMLTGLYPVVDEIRVRINKPEALGGRAREVGVEIRRRAQDFGRECARGEFGEVETLFHNREARLSLLRIDPGAELPAQDHPIARELEWLIDGEIERDGQRLQPFAPCTWPERGPRRYVNVAEVRATLLRFEVLPAARVDPS